MAVSVDQVPQGVRLEPLQSLALWASPGGRFCPGHLHSWSGIRQVYPTGMLPRWRWNLPVNVGDVHSIPELGRCPGEGNGNPLQYFCLENPTDSLAGTEPGGYSPWGCKE